MFIYNGGLLLHFAIMLDKRAEYSERAMVAKDHGKANVQPGIKNNDKVRYVRTHTCEKVQGIIEFGKEYKNASHKIFFAKILAYFNFL